MNLPPIDPAILAQFNIKPEDRLAKVDFGLNIPTKPKQKPLTSDECIKLFGARDAVMMNFVPQMLTALAFEQAEGFIGYCRDHRLSEYKKHNREMRKCIDEYTTTNYAKVTAKPMLRTNRTTSDCTIRWKLTYSRYGAPSPTKQHVNFCVTNTRTFRQGLLLLRCCSHS